MFAIPGHGLRRAHREIMLRRITQFIAGFLPGKYAVFAKESYAGSG
jgi:hypothetical protein